jgi:hypothetical protein
MKVTIGEKYSLGITGTEEAIQEVEVTLIEEVDVLDLFLLTFLPVNGNPPFSRYIFSEEVSNVSWAKANTGDSLISSLELKDTNCENVRFVGRGCEHHWVDTGFSFTYCLHCDADGRRHNGRVILGKS